MLRYHANRLLFSRSFHSNQKSYMSQGRLRSSQTVILLCVANVCYTGKCLRCRFEVGIFSPLLSRAVSARPHPYHLLNTHENSPVQAYEADQIIPNIHVPNSRHLEMMQILESVMACPTANNMVNATNNRPEVHATQPSNSNNKTAVNRLECYTGNYVPRCIPSPG